jgi:peptidyl-prolyl cis-trans isomerase B (cyclophilin B)
VVVGAEDQAVVDRIVQGDKIQSISIEGDITALMENTTKRVQEWNRILDKRFPDLATAE